MVLKDAFDFSLEEIAEALTTTVGAVKAALHGGRSKLSGIEKGERMSTTSAEAKVPSKAALDAFVEAFHAGDLERLTSLLLETGSVEVVRVTTNYGREAARNGVFQGMIFGSRRMAEAETRGGIQPEFKQGVLPKIPRLELRELDGVTFFLHWYAHEDGEFVRALTRVETEGDLLKHVRNYYFTPDVIADVCTELGVPYRLNGYRYW